MTHTDLLALRRRLGLTQAQMAERLFVGLRTYIRYEMGQRAIPRPIQALARTL